MKNTTMKQLKEMEEKGILTSIDDITAGEDTTKLFDLLVSKYGALLTNECTPEYLEKLEECTSKYFYLVLKKFGKSFLNVPQIIEDKRKLLHNNSGIFGFEKYEQLQKKVLKEPAIYVSNHHFKDDILASLLAIYNNVDSRRTFIMFGSIPLFFNTFDGIIAQKNGAILINRKVNESKRSSVYKAREILKNGNSLLICPEGVWDRTPNNCMLDFWPGFYKIAKKEDGTFYPVVPIIHYIDSTYLKSKNNPIRTVIGNPIKLDGLTQEEAIEKVRTNMLTWYWALMEKYGKRNRDDLLEGFSNSDDAWNFELQNRLKTASFMDKFAETTSHKVNPQTNEKPKILGLKPNDYFQKKWY